MMKAPLIAFSRKAEPADTPPSPEQDLLTAYRLAPDDWKAAAVRCLAIGLSRKYRRKADSFFSAGAQQRLYERLLDAADDLPGDDREGA